MPTTFWCHSHFCHFCQLFYGITRMWWRSCRCCGGAYGASFWLMFCLSCHWHLCEAFSLDPDFDYDNTEGLSSKVESHIGRSLKKFACWLYNFFAASCGRGDKYDSMYLHMTSYIYAYMIKVWFQTFVKCNVEAGFMATSIPFWVGMHAYAQYYILIYSVVICDIKYCHSFWMYRWYTL